jgi:hypothetical protein
VSFDFGADSAAGSGSGGRLRSAGRSHSADTEAAAAGGGGGGPRSDGEAGIGAGIGIGAGPGGPNRHLPMLRQLAASNPSLFQLYWKAMDRMIVTALMRGQLAVAEGMYAILSEHRLASEEEEGAGAGAGGGSPRSPSRAGSGSTLSPPGGGAGAGLSREYVSSGSLSARSHSRSHSHSGHLTPVRLVGHADSHRLNAILSSLLLLVGNHRDAARAMDLAISTVDPTRDQAAWASCLLHRSLHSAAVGNFYDARVDLIGASRCAVVCCAVLCCAVLCCAVLWCVVLWCALL